MPAEYAVDHRRRQMTIVASGAIAAADVLAHIEYQVAADAWSYTLLYDGTNVTSLPKPDELTALIAMVRMMSGRHGARGPVAIVSRTAQTMDVARRYALSNVKDNPVGLFLDRGAAEQWLEHAQAARRI